MGYFAKEHKYLAVVETPFVDIIVSEFIRRSGIKKGQRMLEIGPGYGRFSIPLLKQGHDMALSDNEPSMVKRLKENIRTRNLKADVIAWDITKAAPKDKYDVVCGFHVLHHLDDLKQGLANISKALKNNGKIAFLEPNPVNALYYMQYAIFRDIHFKDEKGILNMRKSCLRRTLNELGFKKISISNFGFFPNFVVNTKYGAMLEESFNKLSSNPFGLYRLIIASK